MNDSSLVRVLQSPKRMPNAFGKQSSQGKTPVSRLFASAAAAEPRSRGHNRSATFSASPSPPPEVHFTPSGVVVRRGRVDAHVDALIAARDDAAAEAERRERQGEVIINGNVYHSPPAGGPAPGAKAPRVASTSLVSHLVSPTRARARSGAARRHTAMAPLRTRKHEWSMPDESAPQQSQGGSYFGVRSPSAATAAAAAADSAVYSDTFPLMSGNSPVVLPAGREFQLLSAHNHSHSHYRQASMDGREVAVDLVQQRALGDRSKAVIQTSSDKGEWSREEVLRNMGDDAAAAAAGAEAFEQQWNVAATTHFPLISPARGVHASTNFVHEQSLGDSAGGGHTAQVRTETQSFHFDAEGRPIHAPVPASSPAARAAAHAQGAMRSSPTSSPPRARKAASAAPTASSSSSVGSGARSSPLKGRASSSAAPR